MKRKNTWRCLSFVVFFVFLMGSYPVYASNFNDVSKSHRAYKEITYLAENNIVQGLGGGNFKPNVQLKRSEAAVMLSRMLELDGTQRKTTFKDVVKTSFASGYIQSAVEHNLINGFADGTFRPNEIITRGQMAILLDNAFNLESTENNYFIDKPKGSRAYTAINNIAAAGISDGIDGKSFKSHSLLTRSDFSLFLSRALNHDFRVSVAPIEVIKVIIDPGHGGKSNVQYEKGSGDPGAIGNGLYEKDINLDTSLRIEEYLDNQYVNNAVIDVVLTRSEDVFLSLSQRVDIANKNKADAFVSIHANAFNGIANGTETYYYSSSSSSNEQLSLIRAESKKLAEAIQIRMLEQLNMADRGVKGSNFHVLRENTRMPSTLVELGFIDNKSDAKKLGSPQWREKAAKAISLGIQDYINQK
ncbi:N-acetylmuramoyl-L-alanine amidase [Aquibacillus rhizosphaerae]|uniref:N-acetylmuramoyl-L-alanine amidase n=1 Tax=Aquibacillus rhizosphaerae TaxID=3051431 RepID=A0ABT7KZL7_9BACI|nr:N-acetylmuramoyl-L-alanine amidase [Aquibacillus sp. LR5S19]MDL4838892.1 N-acetylmuramoyl-L-alanine amidase [Aquibacillus sp. LR5S19]